MLDSRKLLCCFDVVGRVGFVYDCLYLVLGVGAVVCDAVFLDEHGELEQEEEEWRVMSTVVGIKS